MAISKREYLDNIIPTETIESSDLVYRWLTDNYWTNRFYADHRKDLQHHFGPPTWRWRGEFLYHVWIFEQPIGTMIWSPKPLKFSTQYLVSSAAAKGTAFEAVEKLHPRDALNFLKWVSSKFYQPGVS